MSDENNKENIFQGTIHDKNMNLSQLKENATELITNQKDQKNSSVIDDLSDEITPVVGNDWMNELTKQQLHQEENLDENQKQTNPQLPNDGVTLSSINENLINTEEAEYVGPGLVLENDELNKPQPEMPKITGITPDLHNHINEYINEMDKTIEEGKQLIEKKESLDLKNNDEENDDITDEMTQDEFDRKYDEAVVVIDKTGMGTIINFTDEEKQKLEKVKKIRLEEVETVNLQTLKTKKIKKKDGLETLIKRQVNVHSTPIVLPASGYTATIRGCSTYELIALMRDSQNTLIDTETKWALIHSKIDETSIGNMEYDEFLRNTAAIDYNIFLFGLLCATYPDDDKIPLVCEMGKCKAEFEHFYTVKSLIRAEKMSEKLKMLVASTIDASHTVESAKAFHSKAAVNLMKIIKLPVSGIVVETYVQSAYNFINKSIKELSENKDPKYNQAAVLSSVVNTMYIPDPDNQEEYYEIDSPFDIAKVIYSLGDTDIIILTKQGDLILEDLSFEFGLMNVTCPKCKHNTQTLQMDLEAILFYKYQQAMSTKIE